MRATMIFVGAIVLSQIAHAGIYDRNNAQEPGKNPFQRVYTISSFSNLRAVQLSPKEMDLVDKIAGHVWQSGEDRLGARFLNMQRREFKIESGVYIRLPSKMVQVEALSETLECGAGYCIQFAAQKGASLDGTHTQLAVRLNKTSGSGVTYDSSYNIRSYKINFPSKRAVHLIDGNEKILKALKAHLADLKDMFDEGAVP